MARGGGGWRASGHCFREGFGWCGGEAGACAHCLLRWPLPDPAGGLEGGMIPCRRVAPLPPSLSYPQGQLGGSADGAGGACVPVMSYGLGLGLGFGWHWTKESEPLVFAFKRSREARGDEAECCCIICLFDILTGKAKAIKPRPRAVAILPPAFLRFQAGFQSPQSPLQCGPIKCSIVKRSTRIMIQLVNRNRAFAHWPVKPCP